MWQAECEPARGALDEQGIWFCEEAVRADDAAALRQEILSAKEAGLLSQSGNYLAVRTEDGSRGGVSLPKPNVFEADVVVGGVLERPDIVAFRPKLASLLESEGELRKRLNDARPELALERLDQAKIQVNSGCGGAFPLHFDVPSQKDSRRHLTAILYLNPDWQEGDGGEVELLPFPFENRSVPPLNNRLVIFAATTAMHRVKPFVGSQGRVCINMWFDGNIAMPFPEPLLEEDYDVRVARILRVLRRQPLELRAFCKVWYCDAIAQSFRDAFEPCQELDEALKLHFEETAEVESRISPVTLKVLRECLPLESRVETGDMVDLFDGL